MTVSVSTKMKFREVREISLRSRKSQGKVRQDECRKKSLRCSVIDPLGSRIKSSFFTSLQTTLFGRYVNILLIFKVIFLPRNKGEHSLNAVSVVKITKVITVFKNVSKISSTP